MAIADGLDRLKTLAEEMRAERDKGAVPRKAIVPLRELLRWFDYVYRGPYILGVIEDCLDENGLRADPDPRNAWSRDEITIDLAPQEGSNEAGQPFDPTVRISVMDAAHQAPPVVNPDTNLQEAMTLMQMRGVSHLLVMPDNKLVTGVITWQSLAERMARGGDDLKAKHVVITNYRIRSLDEPLFEAMEPVARNGFVLVRNRNGTIAGLITANDFSQQFAHLARPFLVIGEIEGYLRKLIRGKFTVDELRGILHGAPADSIIGPNDLTFAAYARLLGDEERWNRLGLKYIDRKEFIRQIEWIRRKRNEVMHFSPDGVDPYDAGEIERLAGFFRTLN